MSESKNIWLTDESLINSLGYHDSYYLRTVCDFLFLYLKRLPIPILTKYVNKSIEVRIGANAKSFPISTKLTSKEWITLVDKWLSSYFPQYKIEVNVKRPLTEQEAIHRLNSGKYSTDEVFSMQIEDTIEESGMITRMYKKKEEFRFVLNGKTSIRHAGGSYKESLLVSQFVKTANSLEGQELRDYIFAHSRHVVDLDDDKEVFINHKGIQLINFFIVNKDYILAHEETPINYLTSRFGKFLIEFESSTHRMDCMKALGRDSVIL